MFKKYDEKTYSVLKKQHNIFVLVGNGFDISVLQEYKKGRMQGKTTSYTDFFEYITYFNLSNKNENEIYKKMMLDRSAGKNNWSDFENSIGELLSSGEVGVNRLEMCVDEIQSHFTRFLNDLVDSDTLLNLNEDVRAKGLSIQSLSEWLKDVKDLSKLKFLKDLDHYHLYYFVFANFNYTSLLDNYLYLDKLQFDPHKYKNVDRNFTLKFQIPCCKETQYSSYVISEVIHPHGIQDVPRSILFGIDLEEYDKGRSSEKRLVKSYWGQYDVKFKSYLEEADLFIIYGMSLGITDAWWMDEIFDQMLNNEKTDRRVELIIYKYDRDGKFDEATVIEEFFNCCIRHADSNEEKEKVREYIHVVTFQNNDTYFLGLKNRSE